MPLSTGCRPLDGLLDGGLEEDAITLVFGEGGSGKTNLALQCAREAAAEGAKVAYVDTEGVSARRLQQVFSTVADDAQDQLLFFQPFSIAEQERMVEKTALLKDVGLVVVDSINMHYRLHIDGGDEAEREASRSLYRQLHHLTTHARKHGVPILITGQVFGAEDATQPFARRVMEHLVKALVRFEKRPDGSRRATVLKHRSIEEGRQARFRIGPVGLEEVDGSSTRSADATASEGPSGRRHADDAGSGREHPGRAQDASDPGRVEQVEEVADAGRVDGGEGMPGPGRVEEASDDARSRAGDDATGSADAQTAGDGPTPRPRTPHEEALPDHGVHVSDDPEHVSDDPEHVSDDPEHVSDDRDGQHASDNQEGEAASDEAPSKASLPADFIPAAQMERKQDRAPSRRDGS